MKRNDAKQVFDIPLYNKIFPFMMKRRCDALVYQSLTLDMTEAVEFVREYRKSHPEAPYTMKVFYLFIAALMRTFAMRPELNRFIAKSRYWQRNELSLNFVVKEAYTDEAPEHSTPIIIAPDATLDEVSRQIDDVITTARTSDEDDETYNAVRFFTKFPAWVINSVIGLAGWLDRRGKAPSILRDADGLHTSVFISNMGSIGLAEGATQHHLYEWGTTSVFVTMGSLERTVSFGDNDELVKKYKMVVGVTVDERIATGFYFVRSFMYLQNLLQNPSLLLERPVLPPPILSKKEYKAKMKAERLEARRTGKTNWKSC